MSFETYALDYVVLGIITGSVYATVAVGLSLVYGILKVVNAAQGDFILIGGYVAVFISGVTNPIISIPASFAVLFLLGMLIERTTIRPVRFQMESQRRGEDERGIVFLILTFGISTVIESIALVGTAAEGTLPTPQDFVGSVSLFGLGISYQQIALVVITPTALALLFLFLYKTRLGKTIRATSQNPEAAISSGIDINKTFMLAVGLAAGLTGVGGSLLAPIQGIFYSYGFGLTVQGFAVVMLGGLENPLAAILSSYILGVSESFVTWGIGAQWESALAFVVMIIILMVRPRGLFGK